MRPHELVTSEVVEAKFKLYRKKLPIKARKMNRPFKVLTLEEIQFGRVGDYLCLVVPGEPWAVRKEVFEAEYEEVKE